MKKLPFFIALPLICGIISIQAQEKQAKWANEPSDPGTTDIQDLNLKYYHSDTGIKYDFCNDNDMLYFVFASSDQTILRQLEIAGFNLQLKAKTKPKTDVSINFNGHPMQRMQGMQGSNRAIPDKNSLRDMRKNNRPEGPDTLYIKGFGSERDFVISDRHKPNSIWFLQSRRNDENNILTLAIPLKELFGASYAPGKITDPVKVQFSINAFSLSNEGDDQGRSPGGMGGGPGGMRSGPGGMEGGPGGMGGGPGGMGEMGGGPGAMPSSGSLTRKTIKFNFTLANQHN